jgi:hypothetical protein
MINETRARLDELIEEKMLRLPKRSSKKNLRRNPVDVTMPAKRLRAAVCIRLR